MAVVVRLDEIDQRKPFSYRCVSYAAQPTGNAWLAVDLIVKLTITSCSSSEDIILTPKATTGPARPVPGSKF